MNRLLALIVFIIVVAALWWALTTVLAVLAVPNPFNTLAIVAFVLLAIWAAVDYMTAGTWFWRRP